MRRLIALAALLSLAAVVWVLWQPGVAPVAGGVTSADAARTASAARDAAPAAPGVSTAAAAAPQAAAKPGTFVTEPSLPARFMFLPDLPDLLPELMPLAEAGDIAAMQHLGRRLMECNDNTLWRRRKERKEAEVEPPQTGPGADRHNDNREFRLEQMRREIAECEALPDTLRNSGLDWLERAAAAGSGRARLEYVRLALREYELMPQREIVAQIEEIQHRRSLAQRYLAEALEHCVPGAFISLRAQSELLEESTDPRQQLIIRQAANHALLHELRAEGARAQDQRDAERDIDYLSGKLDAAARHEAQRRGERLYRPCASR